MKMLLEVVSIPVSDVDRSKQFYVEKIGFHLDGDWKVEDKRYVQLFPEGSRCSITIGDGITEAKPGSIDRLLLVVKDIQLAHDKLVNNMSKRQMSKKNHGVHTIFILAILTGSIGRYSKNFQVNR